MPTINKISILCSPAGAPTEFAINLVDTNNAGINAILATIPASLGVYTYTHTLSGTNVTSQLSVSGGGACQATLFKDGVGYSTSGSCCASIEPSSLLSADAGNNLTLGTDGGIYFSGGSVEIYVDGASIDPTSFALTLTDNSGTTPDIIVPLDILRKTTAPIVTQGVTYPAGTDFQTILAAIINSAPATQTASDEPFTPIVAGATSTGITSTTTQGAVGELDSEIKALQDQPQIFAKVGGVQTTNNVGHTEAEVAVRTGAVVIGATTTPTTAQTKLDVTNGDQDLDDTLTTTGAVTKNGILWEHNTSDSTFLGKRAGSRTGAGSFSVGVGQNALRVSTGNNNTAVGHSTLVVNTNGDNTTAVGANALSSNTTGYNNTAVGSSSQLANISGINNTSLGQLSMRYNTIGYQNTAIGAQALRDNLSGAGNTAIGFASIAVGLTGMNNVAIGVNSLRVNNGNENVAIGVNSSVNNTLGIRNTSLGAYSKASNITGNDNVAIGHSAGYYWTDKSRNTSVGSGAFSATTFSNSTALGYFAQPTASNQIMLGDLAVTEVRTAGAYFGTAFNIVSDKRNKYIGDVIATKTLFGAKIDIYEYQLISDGSWHVGAIAQDVEAIEAKRGKFILTSKSYGLNYGATIEQFNSILGTSFKFYSELNIAEQEVKNKIVEAQGITLDEAKKITETRELVERLKLELDEEGNSTYDGKEDKYLAKYIGFDLTGDETFRKYHVFEEDMLSLSTAINTVLV